MLERIFSRNSADMLTSSLFDQNTFYSALNKDLAKCYRELIIESPFITQRRVKLLQASLQRLILRGVRITVNTRHPQEHDTYLQLEAERGISTLQDMGVQVLFTGGHHRKLVILDRRIVYEGSLNVLSQSESCEMMRRISSTTVAESTIIFIGISKFL